MPIGFDRTIEEERHTIAIVGMIFAPKTRCLTLFFRLDFPIYTVGWRWEAGASAFILRGLT